MEPETVVFLDTETTGFGPQAEVVELAWQVDAYNGTVLAEHHSLVQHVGDIPFPVSQIHGITTAVTKEYGRDIRELLPELQSCLRGDDCLLVCHNVAFDTRVLAYSAFRAGGIMISWPRTLCTMKSLTSYVKVRDKNGNIKDPRLAEAYRWMFDREPQALHRARYDMLATREIYYEGRKRNLWR